MKFFIAILCIFTMGNLFSQDLPSEKKAGKESRSKDAVVIIGDDTITKQEIFDLLLERYKEETYEVTQELIVRHLIRCQYKAEKITVDKATIDAAIDKDLQELRKSYPGEKWAKYLAILGMSEKKLRKEIEKKYRYKLVLDRLIRLEEFRETHVKARHIMLESRGKAEDIHRQLKNNADFAAIARRESTHPALRESAGMLPIVYPGDTHPALDKVLFRLQPGGLSDVIELNGGYHIVQVLEVNRGNPSATWAELKGEIEKSLALRAVATRDLNRWLKKMQKKYKMECFVKLKFMQND